MADLSHVKSILDGILTESNLKDIKAEGDRQELPEGYFLCEVIKAELRESSKGDAMVMVQWKTVEDGISVVLTDKNEPKLVNIDKTANVSFANFYVLKDEKSIRRYIADMIKFEDPETHEQLLDEQCFLSSDLIEQALDILQGMRLYVNVSKSEKDNVTSTWYNPITWNRAEKLKLPM